MERSPQHVHGHYCLVSIQDQRLTRSIFFISFCSLYIGMGFFGYLKYGAGIASTITLNMDLVCFFYLPSFLFFIAQHLTLNEHHLWPKTTQPTQSSSEQGYISLLAYFPLSSSSITLTLPVSSLLSLPFLHQPMRSRRLHWPRLLLGCSALPSSSPLPSRLALNLILYYPGQLHVAETKK